VNGRVELPLDRAAAKTMRAFRPHTCSLMTLENR
jgi:hypothetical protein